MDELKSIQKSKNTTTCRFRLVKFKKPLIHSFFHTMLVAINYDIEACSRHYLTFLYHISFGHFSFAEHINLKIKMLSLNWT
jgi:hypothetical protein